LAGALKGIGVRARIRVVEKTQQANGTSGAARPVTQFPFEHIAPVA
jgi:hypothetical protein